MISNILDRISFWSLFAVITLLPLFFLPFSKIPVETSKGLLLVVGLAISIIFWLAARFSDGKINIPKSKILMASLFVVLVFLISAIFSPSRHVSFFGTMFDLGSFWFMFTAFLLLLMSSIILQDSKNAKIVLLGVIASFGVIFIFQALRLKMPNTLALGILGGRTDNIFGSWNAFGIFAGFSAIVSLFLIEFFSLSKLFKWVLGVLIVFSLLVVAAVNFSLVWELLGVFALIIFVYKISFFSNGKQPDGKNVYFPAFSLAVIMISLLFFMSPQFIGTFLPNHLNLSNIEIGPSFSSTTTVAKQVLMKSPVLGAGPNRFAEMWAMYKPLSINDTQFWDASFSSGSGTLTTFAVTTGALGILAFLVFIILFLVAGIKSFFSSIKNGLSLEMTMFFMASLYLFIASFFYSTGVAIFLLGYVFVGVFIGLSASSHEHGKISLSFLNHPRKSFISILLLVFLMVLTAAAGFKYVERFSSVSSFGKTLAAKTIPEAESSINKAISLYSNDLYLRTYAQVYVTKLNTIVSKGSSLSDTDKADLKTSFDQAVKSAQLAVAYNSKNYLNHKALGSVYGVAASLGVTDAFDKSIEEYQNASTLDPLNPGIKLSIALTYFSNGKNKEAKDFANQALGLKKDYIDALVTLSQIAKNEGNSAGAISYAESALSYAPDNKSLIQYVNSLKGISTPAN